jgi:rfaE bifunctional protein kinase chain/domain
MQANVELICCLGDDDNGKILIKNLESEQIIAKRLLISKDRHTTLKSRIYHQDKYMLRLDRETANDFSADESYILLEKIKQAIDEFKPDVAILQDYNKGIFTAENIPTIIELLQNNDIKIAVDPKHKHFDIFKKVDLFKPNLKESTEALGIVKTATDADLYDLIVRLKETLLCKQCMITLSERGIICLDEQNQYHHFPAFDRKVLDVSGAGDTVIAVAALFLALDYSLENIAFFSNLAGGMTIESKGVVALSIATFLEELNRLGIAH